MLLPFSLDAETSTAMKSFRMGLPVDSVQLPNRKMVEFYGFK
jgi:hypothetical protein